MANAHGRLPTLGKLVTRTGKRQNDRMRFCSWPSLGAALAAVGLASGALAVTACTTDYQLGKEDPNYGGPNALAGQRPPGATVDNEDGGGSSATTPIGSKPKCVAAGGTLADAGTCAVSFSKDVLAAFGTAGCADANCHGGVTPRNEPRIEPSDGPAMWQELQAFTLSTGKPYLDPCSTDDKQSTMGCNLYASGTPGACGVHMPSTGQLPADVITKIETWLKCGSPNN
jgi:hypothetical protein